MRRRLSTLALAGGLALGGLGLTACHSTDPVRLCNETKPGPTYLLLEARHFTVVGGVPKRFWCKVNTPTFGDPNLCWTGYYDSHDISGRFAC